MNSSENTPVPFRGTTLEDVDRAIRDWFDKTVNVRVKTPQAEMHKVPVVFSSGERWSTSRTKQTFRDDNGVLILPIISVRRTLIEPDPTRMALGTQVDKIQIAKRVNPDSSGDQNLRTSPVLGNDPKFGSPSPNATYDVYTMPFPDRLMASYQLVIQTQYITQMNDILQKIWRTLDIQKSFVAPFDNDGRVPPRVYQYGDAYTPPPPLTGMYVVGFFESAATDASNLEEFSDQERVIKYNTDIKVPFVLVTAPEGEVSPLKVERTSYKLILKNEVVNQPANRAELDRVFGKTK